MKYYLIAGEASGDLHASRLMHSLKQGDPEAEFRFFGGDLMAAEGGTRVRHYRRLAYMGFVPVLIHLPVILRSLALCKRDILAWKPDVVILVDYPGFNLRIARFVRKRTAIPVYYYISPKIWAWKEWRIHQIKRDVREMFCILPFEVPFYEEKHRYPVHYVGNPTAQEVGEFRASYQESRDDFCAAHALDPSRPIIALLAGSRRQEIRDNLPAMVEAASRFEDCQLVLAGAPSVSEGFYQKFLAGSDVTLLSGQTYPLLAHATAALVTSGTATLETALFGVPQVVCYETPLPRLIRFAFKHFMKVKYISLVNLIAGREVVPEMLADRFTVDLITQELLNILPGQPARERMLEGYKEVAQRLGSSCAPELTAQWIIDLLQRARQAVPPAPENETPAPEAYSEAAPTPQTDPWPDASPEENQQSEQGE